MDEDEAYPTGSTKLYSCASCGRNFNGDALRKHQPICQKTTTKKRKIFDSGKQRATGSDVQYEKTRDTKQVQIYGERADSPVNNSNWREKHRELIKAIRQARDVTVAMKTGAPLPAFQPSAIPSDYVQCQHCGRHFNSNAAQRHIPFCETQHKRQKINNSANTRGNSRTKYQAPLPGQRKQSSEAQQNGYYQNNGSRSGYGGYPGAGGGGGYSNGFQNTGGYGAQKAFSGGGPRKPIRYDANAYNDNDDREKVVYSIRNKSHSTTRTYGREEQVLRTGRNNQNNEINTLARKRSGNNSQKSSPMNSRTASTQSVNRRSPTPTRAGYGAVRTGGNVRMNGGGGGGAKFCVECGTQFPVEWAKFCCLCGERRT